MYKRHKAAEQSMILWFQPLPKWAHYHLAVLMVGYQGHELGLKGHNTECERYLFASTKRCITLLHVQRVGRLAVHLHSDIAFKIFELACKQLIKNKKLFPGQLDVIFLFFFWFFVLGEWYTNWYITRRGITRVLLKMLGTGTSQTLTPGSPSDLGAIWWHLLVNYIVTCS